MKNNPKNSRNSFYIKSLGCKTNQIEGQIIRDELLNSGYVLAQTSDVCDFYILNTCSVTSHADNQALYLIKQFRAKNGAAKVVLTGCFAQTAKDLEKIDADIILGNDEKLEIVKYLDKISAENPAVESETSYGESQSPLASGQNTTPKGQSTNVKQIFKEDIFGVKTFHHKALRNLKTTRPSIKIQEGCSNRCSYCIIPFARGNSRSDTLENVINEINFLADSGYKEVVIVGIHIGEWGKEFGKTLLDLLKEIEKTRILRYRLGSLYVTEIDDEMVDFLSRSEKFCPHFHLSLQSLCDKTLKDMNRFYTKEYALCVIQKLHKAFKLPFLGCDIITGFPGETEEDFLETYEALRKAKLSFIHSFPYSKREGTKAAVMENQVYEHVKKERTKRLIELSSVLHGEFLDKNRALGACGELAEVLFQKKGKNGKFTGLTRNYIKVYKESDTDLWNTVQFLNLGEYEIE